MGARVEALPARHRLSRRGWIVGLVAMAMLAAGLGTYMALRTGATPTPAIVQTPKPPTGVVQSQNLQPGSTAGPVIPNRIDGIVDLPEDQPNAVSTYPSTSETGGTSSNAPVGSPPPGCLSLVRNGPC